MPPMLFGVRCLTDLEDWIPVVSEANWRPGKSAYELGHHWHQSQGFPPAVRSVLTAAPPPLNELDINYLVVEKPTFLDTWKAPSWTDIMVYCQTQEGRTIIVAVEGKSDEPFGSVVSDWVRDNDRKEEGQFWRAPIATRVRRLRFLADLLRLEIPVDSPLRYQLLHRTASAILEANLHGASAALVLVHSFSERLEANWNDYCTFLNAIGLNAPQKGVVTGLASLGGAAEVGVYFAWAVDKTNG